MWLQGGTGCLKMWPILLALTALTVSVVAGEMCYRLAPFKFRISEVPWRCSVVGGHLVSVRSEQDTQTVQQLASGLPNDHVTIGGNNYDGIWEYQDGTEITWTDKWHDSDFSYYVVFGNYTSTSFQAGHYFVRMFRASDEKSLQEQLTFKKNEFCGLEVGSSKKAARWKLWEKERHQTFLRLFFTAKDTVEFFMDNEDNNPLQAFRTIEAWRKKLTKELGYRCYWNVYLRPCGQEWGEGYGKLHLTEKSLAIVSTEKRPQTLGHWFLKSAIQCKYVGSKRLIIRFEELDEPLVFETEDAKEIARTLSMNMTGLATTPIYDPFPKQNEEPPRFKSRQSVSNKHKPVIVDSSDEDDVDGLHGADGPPGEPGEVTPNTPVPLSPVPNTSPAKSKARNGSDLVSPRQLEKCIKKAERRQHRNSPPAIASTPSVSNNDYPPTYDDAAKAYPEDSVENTPLPLSTQDKTDEYETKRPKGHLNGYRLHPKLKPLDLGHHPEPPSRPEGSPRPVPSPRFVPPERPPKSPMLQRHTPTSALQVIDKFVAHGHPQQPATPPPPTPKRQVDLPATLPRQADKTQADYLPSTQVPEPATLPRRNIQQQATQQRQQSDPQRPTRFLTPMHPKKPVAAPRQPRAALTRVKSKSMECLASSALWGYDDDDSDPESEVHQDLMVGGGLVPINRTRNSRKTIKKKQPTWKRPISSYSDDDVKDDKEEIYDVSNILNHLSNRRDDRSFRMSTMWYVNILSTIDKPPPMGPCDSPPAIYNSGSPPPLPPRDPPSRQQHKAVPITTDEYWSAMIICHTLRKVLVKDPPLPDTLKLSVNLRNKVCMMLYINNLGSKDWRDLADTIGLEYQAVELIEAFTVHHNHETSAEIVLRHWQYSYNKHPYDQEKCPRPCERAELVSILTEMHRHDIVKVIKDNRT